jgi:hypothetical protein
MSNNSLVLIGGVSTLGDKGSGNTPHALISAREANTLGTGDSLPRIAMPITYRPGNLRLNPTGAGFELLFTKVVHKNFHPAIQTPGHMPISSRNTVL